MPDVLKPDEAAAMLRVSRATIYRDFWRWVDWAGGPDACWPWMRARHVLGYGRVLIGRRERRAEGMQALHRCDNPPCCNPTHIFPGTQHDNLIDAREKGRLNPPPRKEFCKRGHSLANASPRGVGRTCRECATIRQRGYRARV